MAVHTYVSVCDCEWLIMLSCMFNSYVVHGVYAAGTGIRRGHSLFDIPRNCM